MYDAVIKETNQLKKDEDSRIIVKGRKIRIKTCPVFIDEEEEALFEKVAIKYMGKKKRLVIS